MCLTLTYFTGEKEQSGPFYTRFNFARIVCCGDYSGSSRWPQFLQAGNKPNTLPLAWCPPILKIFVKMGHHPREGLNSTNMNSSDITVSLVVSSWEATNFPTAAFQLMEVVHQRNGLQNHGGSVGPTLWNICCIGIKSTQPHSCHLWHFKLRVNDAQMCHSRYVLITDLVSVPSRAPLSLI